MRPCQVGVLAQTHMLLILAAYVSYTEEAYWSVKQGQISLCSSSTQSCLNHADSIGCMHTYISPLSHARRFYSKLDILLNEDVLIGKSRACQETLRPPAASTLAELIVHVRSELTLQQIQRIVYMFSRQALAGITIEQFNLCPLNLCFKACIRQMVHRLHIFGHMVQMMHNQG